jgi:iron complex outermembrane recepter protein
MKIGTRQRLLASTLILGAAALAVPSMALADDAPQTIVVTGTRIAQPNLTSNSPLLTVGQQDVKLAGTTTIENLTNSLPQVYGGQNLGQSINSTGTATIDLRGLGPQRTLVLINGRRLQPGDPTNAVADLNTIPASMVERVDVMTGGASAVYGADAVSGVVNFIMQKNFQGVQFDAQYSFNNHQQTDSTVKGLLQGKNYTVPSDANDGQQYTASMKIGGNFDGGKGNITAYVTYFNSQPVTQSKRDYSACGLASTSTTYDSYYCAGSSNGAYGKFRAIPYVGGPTPSSTKKFADNPNGTKTFVPSSGAFAYNFNTLSYLQREDDRYTAGYFAHYEIDPKIELYSEFMFASDRSLAQYAPSGLFAGSGATVSQSYFSINCNNPLMSAAQQTVFCGAAAGTPALAHIQAGYRFTSVPRTDDYMHTAYRINAGVRGDLDSVWHYDGYMQFGRTFFQDTQGGYTSLAKIQNALLVDPVTGQCMSGGACVPLDIFTALGKNISQAAYNYLLTPGLKNGDTTEQVASIAFNGDLTHYHVVSPWAKEGMAVAFGGEYRRESLNYRVDNEYSLGDLSGGSQSKANSGSFDVYELFGEARMPLIEDQPWVKSFDVATGYRFSAYNTGAGINTDTYKAEANYAPVDDLRLRYSYNHAVRSPNINELFSAQVQNLWNGSDPCAGSSPSKSLAACQLSGVTAAQYGSIDQCPASQCGSLSGGNQFLSPEVADTYTYGFVAQPRLIPGLNFSVDYFNIRIRNVIAGGLGGPSQTLSQCLATGSSTFCSAIHRDPTTGDLFGSGFVDARNVNTGFLQTKGIDVNAHYRTTLAKWGLPDWGSLSFALYGTVTNHYVTQPITGLGTYDCVGLYGVKCGTPTPKWRHKFQASWNTPWSVNATLSWRYIAGTKIDVNDPNPFLNGGFNDVIDAKIPDVSYFDLSLQWKVKTGLVLRGGINNLFDKDPPRGDSTNTGAFGGGNGNTFPQTYDTLGRNIFVGLTADF